MTTYLSRISFTASRTAAGSFSLSGSGWPFSTAQKPQFLVQMFPRIKKVAVRFSQHSPMLGQRAL
jgi:hypothetical protein